VLGKLLHSLFASLSSTLHFQLKINEFEIMNFLKEEFPLRVRSLRQSNIGFLNPKIDFAFSLLNRLFEDRSDHRRNRRILVGWIFQFL